jgi:hypothetical protein
MKISPYNIICLLPAQGSCDFKTDLCGWTNDPEQNSPGWRRQFQDLNRSIAFNISG